MRISRFGAALRSSGASTARTVRRRLARHSVPSEAVEVAPDPYRWQTVTILAEPHQIAPDGRLPAPLAALGDAVETRLRPAPGGRGTQLSARTRSGSGRAESSRAESGRTSSRTESARVEPTGPDSSGWKGDDPAREIRIALQQARQLVETGEVLAVEPQPAGRRRPSRGLLVDLMAGNADQEGVV